MNRSTKLRLAGILLCVVGSMFGCATTRPVVVVEAPRELAPSETHVYQAPVHAPTDLATRYQAIDTDPDASTMATTDAGGEDAPEVTEKAAHGF